MAFFCPYPEAIPAETELEKAAKAYVIAADKTSSANKERDRAYRAMRELAERSSRDWREGWAIFKRPRRRV